jgi:hypothetical protein
MYILIKNNIVRGYFDRIADMASILPAQGVKFRFLKGESCRIFFYTFNNAEREFPRSYSGEFNLEEILFDCLPDILKACGFSIFKTI